MRTRTPARLTVLATLLGTAAIAWTALAPLDRPASASIDDDVTAAREQLRQAVGFSEAFKYVTRAVSDSVVFIESVARRERTEAAVPDDEMHRRFFGDQMPFDFGPRMPRERRGSGSGVIVGDDGIIVTNNHVVASSDQVTVRLKDGREYAAEVVGTDPETDLAVLRVDAEDLVPAEFGDSTQLEPGEWVLAIGNPFGLDHTVTAGIVSGTGRSGMGLATFENFIQTDAAINPGNSGGPLVNLKGEVVGINTAISTRNGGNMGIGFAVPSAMVREVLEDIVDDGKVERGWLGVSIRPVTERLAESFGQESTDGVLVYEVVADAPAESAGIEVGDIIVSIDGRAVGSPNELMTAVAAIEPGERIEVALVRDGKQREIDVKLGERPGIEQLARTRLAPTPTDRLGLAVQTISPRFADRLGVDPGEGVVVWRVAPDGPAAEAGLDRGDVILDVAGQPVDTAEAFARAVRDVDPERGVRLRVQREGATRFVVVKPGD
jgi:serine protease Do